MNLYVLDLMLVSFLGGTLGGLGIIVILRHYWRDAFVELKNELQTLRMQVVALQVQNGFMEED